MQQKGWSVFFGVVLFACFAISVAAFFVPGWWLPHLANKDSFGWEVDLLFYMILSATGFFFLLTEVLLVWCMWKYAARPGGKSTYTHGSHKLEMLWTGVPAALLVIIAIVQIPAWARIKYANQMKPPQNIMAVTARQFEWRIRYPEAKLRKDVSVPNEEEKTWPGRVKADAWGNNANADLGDLHVENEVHTWLNANTRIYLRTRDVLHSFYLPNMRLKQDAVPGKVIPVWFKPSDWNTEFKDGKLVVQEDKVWELACAELCGWGHYKMQGKLYVHKDEKSFDAWLEWALKKQRATTEERK